ncbi:hypothetical protein HDU93_006363, partial [Gonapodya sp. JEL0774]
PAVTVVERDVAATETTVLLVGAAVEVPTETNAGVEVTTETDAPEVVGGVESLLEDAEGGGAPVLATFAVEVRAAVLVVVDEEEDPKPSALAMLLKKSKIADMVQILIPLK